MRFFLASKKANACMHEECECFFFFFSTNACARDKRDWRRSEERDKRYIYIQYKYKYIFLYLLSWGKSTSR